LPATVAAPAPGSGTPSRTETVIDGGSATGTRTLTGRVSTFTTSALAVGTHTITTSYGGDGNFNGNTRALTGNPQIVNKANTTTRSEERREGKDCGQDETSAA